MADSSPRTMTALAFADALVHRDHCGRVDHLGVRLCRKDRPTDRSEVVPTGDEPPIRVRNGSVDVELPETADWTADGDAWTPSKGRGSGTFQVKVESAPGYSCKAGQTGSGKEVWVWYSETAEQVTFKSEGRPERRRSGQRPSSRKPAIRYLRYGQEKPGYITGVGVRDGSKTWSCTFSSAAELIAIDICSSPGTVCR